MDDCSQNALCVSLPPEVRRRLCENCIKASYAQDTIMPIDTNHPIVIVEGIVLAVSSDKPLLLMAPGSLLLTPYFTPQKATPWLRSAQEVGEEIRQVRYRCITRAVFSTLTNKAVEALLEDREFLRTVFDNQLAQSDLITNYQRALYHHTAYTAVRFILQLARYYNIKRLTHAQIALLTGRNRTTVTKVMGEIMLAEPELVEGLE